MAASPPSPPPSQEGDHPFSDASIVFAVDRSGSTLGRPLQCELSFIAKVSRLLSTSSRFNVKVVPWDSTVDGVLPLEGVRTIRAGSGTNPAAILTNSTARAAIASSSLWFLMTDGLVSPRKQEMFARLVPQTGVHGVACIPVLFGSTSRPVSQCNISVGVSLFSLCPNSAFLYCDTSTEQVIVMQTKGIFNTLLNGAENPVIDNDATPWHSFPRLEILDLADILLPAPKKLTSDQVALQDGLVVNFEDLLANRLSPQQTDKIFSNEDNLNTITMSAQTRGAQTNRQYQNWVQVQQIHVRDPLSRPRLDRDQRARLVVAELTRLMNDGEVLPPDLQRRLRRAHIANMEDFLRSCHQELQMSRVRGRKISQHYKKSEGPIYSARALTSGDKIPVRGAVVDPVETSQTPVETSRSPVASVTAAAAAGIAGASALPGEERWKTLESLPLDPSLRNLLYTPGFRCVGGSFQGDCSICGITDATLAWLFRGPAVPGASVNMDFPLAVGALAEVAGMLSSTLCCEPCSTYYVATGRPIRNETMIAALPMVRYEENASAYDLTLQTLLPGPHLAKIQAFLSILLTRSKQLENNEDVALFKRAVKWTRAELLPSLRLGSSSLSLKVAFDKLADPDSPILGVPLPAFPVLLQAAELDGIPLEARRAAAFRRYLFLLTESTTALLGRAVAENRVGETKQALSRYLWVDDEDSDMVVISQPSTPRYRWGSNTPLPDAPLPAAGELVNQHMPRTRVLNLPMPLLRGTPLLSEAEYALFEEGSPEMHFVGHGTGCATAAFLHVLMDVVEKHRYDTALDLFKLVVTRKQLTSVFASPQTISVDVVADLLKALHL